MAPPMACNQQRGPARPWRLSSEGHKEESYDEAGDRVEAMEMNNRLTALGMGLPKQFRLSDKPGRLWIFGSARLVDDEL